MLQCSLCHPVPERAFREQVGTRALSAVMAKVCSSFGRLNQTPMSLVKELSASITEVKCDNCGEESTSKPDSVGLEHQNSQIYSPLEHQAVAELTCGRCPCP